LAGAVADIVQCQVGSLPSAVNWATSHVHAGAIEAGRRPEDVEISVHCAMWMSDDLKEARAKCRWAAATAANHLARMARASPDHGMPEEVMRIISLKGEYDYYQHAKGDAHHLDYLTDDLIDNFAIVGNGEQCLTRIRQLHALGVSEVAPGLLNGDIDQLRR